MLRIAAIRANYRYTKLGFGAKPDIDYIFGDISTAAFNSAELKSYAFTKRDKAAASARLAILINDFPEFPGGVYSIIR